MSGDVLNLLVVMLGEEITFFQPKADIFFFFATIRGRLLGLANLNQWSLWDSHKASD